MTAIMILMVPELLGSLNPLLRHDLSGSATGLQVLAVALAVPALLAIAGLWRGRSWALWAVLVVLSLQTTIELAALAEHVERALTAINLILITVTALMVFRATITPSPNLSDYQRALFAVVALFAGTVAFWGLYLPKEIARALPLSVPPLHARFLGAMYLSGTVFMVIGIAARRWSEVRVMTLMLAIWTGMLGAVSALHLEAFDWSRLATWLWFFAYIDFPLIALWIAWTQRAETHSDANSPAISDLLRTYLNVQGATALALALCLLFAPGFMSRMWPWAIKVLLAQIYGAPFLSYGLGSLYAARLRTWSEVRIVIFGTLAFTVGVLLASMLHANLFDARTPSAWLWFGSFAVASAALLLFTVIPVLCRTPRSSAYS